MAQRHGASWGSAQPKRSTTPSREPSYGSEATATYRTEFARCRRGRSVGPGSLVVYIDTSMRTLNTAALAIGSLLRFNGLLFNDNGTLRMDCAEVWGMAF